MALKNLMGGLALDETLKQLIYKFRDWKDPTWVTSHPDVPVHVDGRVKIGQDPMITGGSRMFAVSGTPSLLVPTNIGRTALMIHNRSTGVLDILASNNGGELAGLAIGLFTIELFTGDYWEMPQGINGIYKGPVYCVASGTGFGMYTEHYS